MSLSQIRTLSRRLTTFLALFAHCFRRPEGRQLLRLVIRGQLSNLPRKNVEAIALQYGVPPRTLQRFFESMKWDEGEVRDGCQQHVGQRYAHSDALGLIDESAVAKSGKQTAGVQRQYSGRAGKVDNCVVGVHVAYAAPNFHCLLDSQVYLPQEWAEDPKRRKDHHVPDEVQFQTKQQIALQLVERALTNGIVVSAWTCDEAYGRDGKFFDGMEELGQIVVAEVPSNFRGWLQKPHKPANSRRSVSRRRPCHATCTVQNLVRHSPLFYRQPWRRYRIRDSDKGPEVWEIKWAVFYRCGADGWPTRRHCLIVARNVLTKEKKYFVANRAPADRRGEEQRVSLRWLLRVAFGRFVVEQCFREAKQELGMDDYQLRGWGCIHRHYVVTQLSYLFCAKIRHAYGASSELGRLTIDQVRRAIAVWLFCGDLSPSARRRRVEQELERQAYYQRRSTMSRESHTRRRLALLLSIGVHANRIRSCCIPPPI